MSLPRKISPMLDGFLLGEACYCHEAVQCFPAIDQRTGDKYIVKVISVPRSRVQMDALLLTGAFTSKQAANNYFKEQAREILQEAKALRHMTTIGGFIDYDCFQVVPGLDDYGFEVYLLSPFRTSLQSILETDAMTHQGIINLTLNMANALSACRHAGYLYLNLKATNVFRTERGYRIGDLGFVNMSGSAQPRLPDQYRSPYTPPELLADPTAFNETSDVYQLGLLLYQCYNGGVLPGKEDLVGALYAPPQYADYEMAQIILRACAPDPGIRWVDPGQMAEALVQYAQRNDIQDTPVVPSALKSKAGTSQEEPFLPEEDDSGEEMASTEERNVTIQTAEAFDVASSTDESFPTLQNRRRQPAQKQQKRTSAPKKKKSTEAPHPRKRCRRLSFKRLFRRPIIWLLAAILLLELALGIWLLFRNRQPNENDEAAFPNASITTFIWHQAEHIPSPHPQRMGGRLSIKPKSSFVPTISH